MSGSVLAVDIGGTKFAVALVDPEGNVRATRRAATPPGGDERTLWKALGELIDSVLAGSAADGLSDGALTGVGIGCGGPMAWPEGAVSPLNMPGWRGFPLRARLAERFPGVPVRVHNDAVCLAAAEHWRGAGRGSANMLGMVVSTGVGGGLILGGRLIDGASGNAGHIGHIVVDPGGPVCGCGGRGCLEEAALVGDGKVGKSIFTLYWIWCAITGRSCLGDIRREPINVLYFDRENSLRDIVTRLTAFGATPDDLQVLHERFDYRLFPRFSGAL
ncbi:ROK family protein, partial [Streptosporangium sp. NPDC003464]